MGSCLGELDFYGTQNRCDPHGGVNIVAAARVAEGVVALDSGDEVAIRGKPNLSALAAPNSKGELGPSLG